MFPNCLAEVLMHALNRNIDANENHVDLHVRFTDTESLQKISDFSLHPKPCENF